MSGILVLENVTKTYGDNKVVDDLSFCVERGEVFALLGANGAGKTTTIKMILGLAKKSSGKISIESGTKIGYSPETPYFPPYLTAMEVMRYYAGIEKSRHSAAISKKENSQKQESNKDITDKEYLKSLLETVGLEDTKTKVKRYSKGMVQRLAMAQALIADPDILILDEPTAGLDAVGRKHNIELMKKMKNKGKTIIINSHILHDIEAVCDRGIIMKKGVIKDTWTNGADGESLENKFIKLVGEE